VVGHGRARRCDAEPHTPAYAAVLCHTRSVTRTPSNSHAKGVAPNVIQRQLGHRNLGVTSIYLEGIDPSEIIETVHARRPPMVPASAGLALPATR
jgi:hypothetical protein